MPLFQQKVLHNARGLSSTWSLPAILSVLTVMALFWLQQEGKVSTLVHLHATLEPVFENFFSLVVAKILSFLYTWHAIIIYFGGNKRFSKTQRITR